MLPKLVDPRDAKVGSIQQNPITHSKLLFTSTMISKQHLTFLCPLYVAGGFWAVILSRAAWKKSWAGRDPTRSIILMDRSVAITGDMVRAQLLTA